jgi:hypothetical protein
MVETEQLVLTMTVINDTIWCGYAKGLLRVYNARVCKQRAHTHTHTHTLSLSLSPSLLSHLTLLHLISFSTLGPSNAVRNTIVQAKDSRLCTDLEYLLDSVGEQSTTSMDLLIGAAVGHDH